jgi:predicted Zn-dependent protease
MFLSRRRSVMTLAVVLALSFSTGAVLASASSTAKRSRSDTNINAIGHRNIAKEQNWYSADKEAQFGKQLSDRIEGSVKVLSDLTITDYLAAVAQKLARNSDASFPITLRIIDSEDLSVTTLPGGYQYLSRGLLLRLQDECELAAVLARGIAHTALHSFTAEETRRQMMDIASIPLIVTPVSDASSAKAASISVPLGLLRVRREHELDADYFGIQYAYKTGYDTACFIRSVQRLTLASPATKTAEAFSPFPPLSERLMDLQQEVAALLPNRQEAIVSTPEFVEFKKRLSEWKR